MIGDAGTSRQQALFCDRESLLEWKVIMKTSNTRARKFGSTVGKIVMALIFTSMIGGTSIAPAFGKDIDRREGYYERDRYNRDRYDRDRYNRYRYERGRRVYKSYPRYYRDRVEAPLPYIYTPDQYRSPGINLFVPFYIR
jgi:hypothetical protein